MEESVNFLLGHFVLPELVELLSGFDFEGAQVVLVGVVLVDFVLAECCVAVAFPTAAEIYLVVDASDAVAAAYHQAQRIVLAVAGVGNLQLSQDGCEEGSGCSEAVDAQGIVASVHQGPFAVVDEARRQGVQLEVAHTV